VTNERSSKFTIPILVALNFAFAILQLLLGDGFNSRWVVLFVTQVSVPAWFTMDTRLGSMSVHLDTPQCFSAEMYAVDLHVPGASEELKVSLRADAGCNSWCTLFSFLRLF